MILVTGSNGQLGSELKQILSSNKAIFVNHQTCDITKKELIESLILDKKIKIIINCAAYTNVDQAEAEVEKAYEINAIGAENLAFLAKKHSAILIHISTDYVFDGKNHLPLSEEAPVNPTSHYGKSKREGERRVLEIAPEGIIIRTSWLYSFTGKNFVKTILQAGRERDFLMVVDDQIGTPTYARDLALAIVKIVPQLAGKRVEVYHYSNEGVASWYDFAKAIVDIKELPCMVRPVDSSQYPAKATRPAYSVLNKRKIKEQFGLEIPYWRDSLKLCLETHF